jgi:hypothetical protein
LENWIGAQFVVFICFLTTWEDPGGKYGSGSGNRAGARLLRMGDLFENRRHAEFQPAGHPEN